MDPAAGIQQSLGVARFSTPAAAVGAAVEIQVMAAVEARAQQGRLTVQPVHGTTLPETLMQRMLEVVMELDTGQEETLTGVPAG